MSLLKEIQNAAIDGSSDLGTLLRKCRLLAARLKHDDFEKWVQSELNGYAPGANVPDYRKFHCPCFGHFAGPMGSGIRNAPIAEFSIPEEIREQLTRVQMRQGVSELKDLADGSTNAQLKSQWPADACGLVVGQYANHFALAQAWTSVPSSAVVGILSTVRNRILDFAIEIEASNPAAGEASPGTTPVSNERVSQVFNMYISGNGTTVAAGHDFSQTATVNVQIGKLDTLLNFLKSLPDEVFSGLHLMCLMFAGFKRIAPEHDLQMDLNEPFLIALEMFETGEQSGV